METGIVAIEHVRSKIDRIQKDLGINEVENDLLANEKSKFGEQLLQTMESCGKLRDGLLGFHAAHALADIDAMSKAQPDRVDLASDHLLETFNVQATITDFSEAFEELERENQRLKLDEEGAKLLS